MGFETGVDLLPYNTFHIAAKARFFTRFDTLDGLRQVLEDARKLGVDRQLVLGGGSNILLTGDFDGLVLKNELGGIELSGEDEGHYYVRAGAGVNWHRLVMYCVEHDYAGMENLSLIPGSVGASPMQNIGAYGVEIKDIFHELEALSVEDGSLHRFGNADCGFGYRESVFKHRYKGRFIITSVTYRLDKKPRFHTEYGAIRQELERMGVQELSIGAIARAVIQIRSSKLPDPAEVGNAGSFFKNPVIDNDRFGQIRNAYPDVVAFPAGEGRTKLAAGWLIEQCGWKGYRKGDAGCYPKQALVLVNWGQARGTEIYQLSEEIITSVEKKFGVSLDREVNIIR
jgi:UDP-N-acetylmuramate dehydrogenase